MIWPALIAIAILLALFAAAYFTLWRADDAGLTSHPRPAASYDEAVGRVKALQALEAQGLNPECQTQLLSHGQRTASAVVLLHGYTSCPKQFVPLGQLFFDRGYNVLVSRLPRHGLADRLTTEHGLLTAAELAAHADEVVDIAVGLGEHVSVAGLSGGGITTAWAAQTRPEVDRAVIIAPAFGFKNLPANRTIPSMNAALLLPDAFVWWEPELQEKSGFPYTYPRYSRRALAQILRLGFATRAHAGRHPPAARSIVLVTNANDTSVDNAAVARMAAFWQAQGARDVRCYEFPAELKLDHDLIDPAAPAARVDVVYPKLLELMEKP